MQEQTKAEKLAGTLDFIAKEKVVTGLLPKSVAEAASLLREQDKELATLRTAMAAKAHVVEASAEREQYRQKIRATFVITDPRLYYGEMVVDDRWAMGGAPHDWQLHVARQLVRVGTAEWIRDLEEKTLRAIVAAIAMAPKAETA